MVALLSFCVWIIHAQHDRSATVLRSAAKGLEYEMKAGFHIGGASPLPLPHEIREISGYNPTLAIPIEGTVTQWLGKQRRWGVTAGLKLENKGMITRSRVKNYRTEIIGDGGEKVSGRWTGYVKTKMRTAYLTMPLLAAYRLDERWVIRGGAYVSYLTEGDFSGHVHDGYLREGDPTGPKIEFKDGRIATYDFSNRLRHFVYGAQMGISWRAFKHFNTFADLSWGLNGLFKSDFETISFALYPIYLNAGFGYVF